MNTVNFSIKVIDNTTGVIKNITGGFDGINTAVATVRESINRTKSALERFADTSFRIN